MRRFIELNEARALELRPGTKQLYFAAVLLATTIPIPLFLAAQKALRGSGVSGNHLRTVLNELAQSMFKGFSKGARGFWGGPLTECSDETARAHFEALRRSDPQAGRPRDRGVSTGAAPDGKTEASACRFVSRSLRVDEREGVTVNVGRSVVRTGPISFGSRGSEPAPDRTWRERLKALENVRPLLKMVWDTSPSLTFISISSRLLRAALPVATLYVSKLIIDAVVRSVRGGHIESARVWRLVAVELGVGRSVGSTWPRRSTGRQSARRSIHESGQRRADAPCFDTRLGSFRGAGVLRQTGTRPTADDGTDAADDAGDGARTGPNHAAHADIGTDRIFSVAVADADLRRAAGLSGRNSFCLTQLFTALPLDAATPRA